jgi:parallel beta-helix repeat protein
MLERERTLRRLVSSIIVALLFLGLFVFAFTLNIQPAKAQSGTIYIMPDGSVTPSTANITTSDNVTYTFTGNNYLPIIVQRSNIIINGKGHTLQVPGGTGFSLSGVRNVTIKNTTITNSWWGIGIWSSSSNSISGNNITNNSAGIFLNFSSNKNRISGNNIAANSFDGIWLGYSSNNTVSRNNVTANHGGAGCGGIWLVFSSNSMVSGNNIAANSFDGIILGYYSSKNTISGNNITNNSDGIYLYSSSDNTFYHNNFINNTQQVSSDGSPNIWDNGYPSGGNYWSDYTGVDLKSGPYQNLSGSDGIGDTPYVINGNNTDHYPLVKPWASYENGTIYILSDGSVDPSGAPILRKGDLYSLSGNITSNSGGIVIERDNMTLDGAGYTLRGTGAYPSKGIDLSGKSNITVMKTKITAFYYGVSLYSSSNCTVSGNIITNSTLGISFGSSSNISISGNTITNSYTEGIGLWSYSSHINVFGNTITASKWSGIMINCSYSNHISISGNTITANNGFGVMLAGFGDRVRATYCNISGNTIANNCGGVGLYYSYDNMFYHNNFINNTPQVSFMLPSGYANVWDNGYPSGGNYWSDYTGVDLKNGPYQNLSGSDGIGDTPYVIDASNVDHYPLMGPFSSFYSKVTGTSISCVSNSTISGLQMNTATINFTVSGAPSTTGFCTVTILHSTLPPPYTIEIDGKPVSYTTIYSNATESVLYFTYTLSTHEVTITHTSAPSPRTPVGGVAAIITPKYKSGLLAPYIALASTILVAVAATAISIKRVKRRKEKQ